MNLLTPDSVLDLADVRGKVVRLEAELHRLLSSPARQTVPRTPARDVSVLPVRAHPPKLGVSTTEGQARLLHDLASIELQAMELGVRTLREFPDAPAEFREQLAEVTLGEGQHLGLCLDSLEALGFAWGRWPVHTALWDCVAESDTLLDRILIVHRYLEGSGLDAGDSILRRLSGVESRITRAAVQRIVEEEIGHVDFGSRWYREVCRREGLHAADDFGPRLERLREVLPPRREAVVAELRRAAGFSEEEIETLRRYRVATMAGVGRA